MTNEHARPPKPKKKHRLREVTDPDTVAAVERNEWADPIGGFVGERVFYDPRLQRQQIPPNTGERQ